MKVQMRVDGFDVEVYAYKIKSTNAELAAQLSSRFLLENGPRGSDPNPDLHIAMAIVREFGQDRSTIISADSMPALDPWVVY